MRLQLLLAHTALLLQLRLMLLLLCIRHLDQSIELTLQLLSFMISRLHLQLHIVLLLSHLVALGPQLRHFELVVLLGLLELLLVLVSFLGFNLARCQLVFVLGLHLLYLLLEQGHNLDLVLQELIRHRWLHLTLILVHAIGSIGLIGEISGLLAVDLAVVDEASLGIGGQAIEALGKDVIFRSEVSHPAIHFEIVGQE
mmetsp:Transcript_36220/g.44169  ORF Transcript_36220/g.44169 Transcript_36220/m.44169 type:complete len:198 (+) Transcript_36220:1018-1611(+)